jgi:ribosomal protein L14
MSFLRLILFDNGPLIYFDNGFIFLVILIPALLLNFSSFESFINSQLLVLHNQIRQMSPFILYLYLNPLYSILGGSTSRAEPFIKKPIRVTLRKNPLYKWNVLTHLTLVLSVMIQKESWVIITDNTNVKWVKTFHLYKGFFRKVTRIGFFIKGSARLVEPPRIEYKGFKYKYKIKGDICRIWLCRTNSWLLIKDSKLLKFNNNAGINITKKNKPVVKVYQRSVIKKC